MNPDHEAELARCAVDVALAEAYGLREATTIDDLPEWARWLGPEALPALVFPWRTLSGEVVEQVKPARPMLNGDGKASKYLWPKGVKPVLNVLQPREGATRVVIVEGTKQTHAVLRYAPPDWLVVGIGGCSTWTVDGVANGDLSRLVGDRDVTVLFDADLDRNIEVWTAASKLGQAADLHGARSVTYASLPARGSNGIDDVLGSMYPDARAPLLQNLISKATKKLPPRPKASRNAERVDWIELAKGERPVLNVEDDRLDLGTRIVTVMRGKWDGTRLFMYGDVLTLVENETASEVGTETFTHLVNRATKPMAMVPSVGLVPAEYSATTMRIARDVANRTFSHMAAIARTPFVREDGTVCHTAGFDAASGVLLLPSPGLEAVAVPDDPSSGELRAAVKLLAEEWLGDFPFKDQPSLANMLALVITPFIRHLVGIVPLAVLDGLGAGVGKGLLAEIVSVLVIGRASEPFALPDTRDEAWKALHSHAGEGHSFLFLDEAHTLRGEALAAAITAPVLAARILGVSRIGSYPNRMTWLAAGNNVRVQGDLYRRVYQVRLEPKAEGWENRPASAFRHPNLRMWTEQNRADLLSAVLTLVRGWYARGCPEPEGQGAGFGSFEDWQRIAAGVLETAGVDGFLGNMAAFRDDAAEDRKVWTQHLRDLRAKYGDMRFTVRSVRDDILRDEYRNPLDIEDSPDPKDAHKFGYALGTGYRRWRGLPLDGLTLLRDETIAHGNVSWWRVTCSDGGSGGSGGSGHETRACETHTPEDTRTYGEEPGAPHRDHTLPPPVAVDFETPDADHLASGRHEGPFCRVLAWADGAGEHTTTDTDEMRRVLTDAPHLLTSGGWRFDLPAAALHLGLDVEELVLKSDDTEATARLESPPRDPNESFSLSTLARAKLDADKDDALPRLKRRFKGYDRIPVDDEEYLRYARQDVALTRDVAATITVPDEGYLARERQAAALAASLTVRGVRVDTSLVASRVADRDAACEALMDRLAGYGIPRGSGPTSVPWRTKAALPALDEMVQEVAPGKQWPRGANGAPLSSADLLERAARAGGRLGEFCTLVLSRGTGSSFLDQVDRFTSPAGRVHPQHRITGAAGRWSTSAPNLMGVGKRSDALKAERDIILAEPGEVFISVDLAGIDARAVAGLSGDPAYAELMAPGIDIHLEIAEVFFGERTEAARKEIKPFTHGIPYGRTAKALAQAMVARGGAYRDRPVDEVVVEMQDKLDGYYARFTGIRDWQETVRALCENGGRVDNGFGRGVRAQPGWEYTQAPSRQGQSCARDLAMEGLFRIRDAGLWPRVRMFIHDEVVLSVPEADADRVGAEVADLMSFEWESPSGLVVPIIAVYDGVRGHRWSEAYR